MSQNFVALCGAVGLLLLSPAVRADEAWTYSGNTRNGPTFNRPVKEGSALSGLIVAFHAQRFELTSDTICFIHGTQDYDGFLLLYRSSFNPASPLNNLVPDGIADDGIHGVGTSDLGLKPGGGSGLALPSDTYILVTTAFAAGQQGSFQNTVRCAATGSIAHGSCPAYFASPTALNQQICLNGRFIVKIDDVSNSATGIGTPVRMGSSDSALFWFYSDNNWEVLVKVLDACAVNNRHWVFVAATTNQRFRVSVGDGNSLEVKTYENPLGVNSPAFTDTGAFPCP